MKGPLRRVGVSEAKRLKALGAENAKSSFAVSATTRLWMTDRAGHVRGLFRRLTGLLRGLADQMSPHGPILGQADGP